MTYKTMSEIADALGTLYHKRAHARILQWQHEQDAESRRVALTPVGDDYKALGSNDGMRRAALDEIFAGDEQLRTITSALDEIRADLEIVQAEIDALEAARRAEEWAIRGRLATALEAGNIQPNHRGPRNGDYAFDDAADEQALEELPF